MKKYTEGWVILGGTTFHVGGYVNITYNKSYFLLSALFSITHITHEIQRIKIQIGENHANKDKPLTILQ